MTPWLTPQEVAELTGGDKPCTRRSTQCKRLAEMGIPFRPNYGGRPLVERVAVLKYKERVAKKPSEPNWDSIAA
jgi:uncharacterized protein DUF4224